MAEACAALVVADVSLATRMLMSAAVGLRYSLCHGLQCQFARLGFGCLLRCLWSSLSCYATGCSAALDDEKLVVRGVYTTTAFPLWFGLFNKSHLVYLLHFKTQLG